MRKFFKSSKDDKAEALCTSLIKETKHLAEIYRKNISKINELNRSSFEQGIQGYGIDTEIIKFENQLFDKSFKNFKFTYALIRFLYSYMESILIEIDIPELNKKEFENIVNPNLPSLEKIISIDKVVGFHYKDEYDDPIQNYLYEVDESGEFIISCGPPPPSQDEDIDW
tara:strand:- start:651 stop:1157 length:507 start_codon:yes stop_codon:yes gene_type:complete